MRYFVLAVQNERVKPENIPSSDHRGKVEDKGVR